MRADVASLAAENAELKAAIKSLDDDAINLKRRSVRNNLLFLGISVETRSTESDPTSTHSKNCAKLGYFWCKSVSKIDDPKDRILIDRAHRIVRVALIEVLPIVAKFKDISSKVTGQSTQKAANRRE